MSTTKLPAVTDRLALSVAEVAHMLGVSQRSLWKWVAAGTFPRPLKIGGSRAARWLRSDIEAHLDSQRKTA
jgi:predicted DNA-binding transcriptional regulator AlpA